MKNRQELIQEMYKLYNGYDEAVKQFVDFANRCDDIKMLNTIVEAHRYNGKIRRVVKRKFKINT
jgi:hypothetical protein